MRATLLAALRGVLAGSIGDGSGPVLPYVVLEPILDSLFVGEVDPLPSVTYFDGRGNSRTPLPIEIRWQSSDTTILSVDSASRRMTARGRGIAIVVATVNSVSGQSLVAVSNALDLRLLLDTVYAMPGDTLTVPVAVKRKNSSPDSVVWMSGKSRYRVSFRKRRNSIASRFSRPPCRVGIHPPRLRPCSGNRIAPHQ